ncbi:hypothetical protein [Streptomyces sedi]|nr:hypothetical protein [Streptomyces sedi]
MGKHEKPDDDENETGDSLPGRAWVPEEPPPDGSVPDGSGDHRK